jgi:uncharacterized protein YkwD
MRLAVVVVCAAACGRVGFGDVAGGGSGGGDGGGGGGGDGASVDSAPVPTTCGDQVCSGTGGETCKSCTGDCRTTSNVCGNGACGTGESGTSCFVDCGPEPWAWTGEEDDLFVRINAARTGGTACAGGPTTTAPALLVDAPLDAAARDLAWEQAHFGLSINRCNGQSLLSYLSSVGANGSRLASSSSSTTNAQRMADWIADTSSCSTLMSTSYTRAGVAVAVDMNNGYVALFR